MVRKKVQVLLSRTFCTTQLSPLVQVFLLILLFVRQTCNRKKTHHLVKKHQKRGKMPQKCRKLVKISEEILTN